MSKQRIEMIVLDVLIVVLVITAVVVFAGGGKPKIVKLTPEQAANLRD